MGWCGILVAERGDSWETALLFFELHEQFQDLRLEQLEARVLDVPLEMRRSGRRGSDGEFYESVGRITERRLLRLPVPHRDGLFVGQAVTDAGEIWYEQAWPVWTKDEAYAWLNGEPCW